MLNRGALPPVSRPLNRPGFARADQCHSRSVELDSGVGFDWARERLLEPRLDDGRADFRGVTLGPDRVQAFQLALTRLTDDRVGSWLYPYSPAGGHSHPAGHRARIRHPDAGRAAVK